jgi:hypothetical protein
MGVLEKISPSGPCNPGLGVLAFFISIPVVGILIIRSIYLAFAKDKNHWATVVLHIILIAIFLILASSGIL